MWAERPAGFDRLPSERADEGGGALALLRGGMIVGSARTRPNFRYGRAYACAVHHACGDSAVYGYGRGERNALVGVLGCLALGVGTRGDLTRGAPHTVFGLRLV